jgi:hypothetical protein
VVTQSQTASLRRLGEYKRLEQQQWLEKFGIAIVDDASHFGLHRMTFDV